MFDKVYVFIKPHPVAIVLIALLSAEDPVQGRFETAGVS